MVIIRCMTHTQQTTSFSEHTLRVGTHRLHVEESGVDDAAAFFVLVHGIGVSTRYFRPLMYGLSRHGRVISIDLPGFGTSSRPKQSLDMADFARVVGEALQQLHVSRAVLVGHSMGCEIVAELSVQQPDIAQGLILIGPTVDPDKRSFVHYVVMLLHNTLHEPLRVTWTILRDYWRCGPYQYFKTLRCMLAHRMEVALAMCQAPTVIARGENDKVVPHDWAVAATGLLPRGELAEIPGAAHAVQMVQADRVAEICCRLLNAAHYTEK